MSWLEIVIVALVALWLAGTVVFLLRHRGKGCGGCCADCTRQCGRQKKSTDGH